MTRTNCDIFVGWLRSAGIMHKEQEDKDGLISVVVRDTPHHIAFEFSEAGDLQRIFVETTPTTTEKRPR